MESTNTTVNDSTSNKKNISSKVEAKTNIPAEAKSESNGWGSKEYTTIFIIVLLVAALSTLLYIGYA